MGEWITQEIAMADYDITALNMMLDAIHELIRERDDLRIKLAKSREDALAWQEEVRSLKDRLGE